MSAARRDPLPIIPFGLAAFAATLFALGLALGTTIAVGMLFFIQMKIILRNNISLNFITCLLILQIFVKSNKDQWMFYIKKKAVMIKTV